MTKNLKKYSFISLTLIALMGLSACGSKQEDSTDKATDLASIEDRYTIDENTPAWQLDTKEDNSLTWYVNADWWNTEFGSDIVTKKIKEDLDIDITFITGDDSKLNTYFAGGEMPDIVTLFDANSSVARKADSWALPLQDLADKYDPYFYQTARKDTLNWYKLDDGKTYGYPSYSTTQEDIDSGTISGNEAFIIRKDVYEAIGSPDLTTPDGFITAMNDIKEKFPDLIPFGFNGFSKDGSSNGSMDKVLQDMLAVPYTDTEGNYYDRNLDDEYLNWIKTFRQVRQDGNINDDSFTDDGDRFAEKISTGKYATILISNFVNNDIPLQSFATKSPDSQYIAVDAIQNSQSSQATIGQGGLSGFMINYITKQAKDPAKAIQVFTYLLSDYGQMLVNYGIENENYTVTNDGTIEFTEETRNVQVNEPEKWQKEYRIGGFILFGHDRFKGKL